MNDIVHMFAVFAAPVVLGIVLLSARFALKFREPSPKDIYASYTLPPALFDRLGPSEPPLGSARLWSVDGLSVAAWIDADSGGVEVECGLGVDGALVRTARLPAHSGLLVRLPESEAARAVSGDARFDARFDAFGADVGDALGLEVRRALMDLPEGVRVVITADALMVEAEPGWFETNAIGLLDASLALARALREQHSARINARAAVSAQAVR